MNLKLFKYNYFPYEQVFIEREIRKLGGKVVGRDSNLIIASGLSIENAKKLTYIEKVRKDKDDEEFYTIQATREPINGRSSSHYQSTRYGPHGLHDYKGKFNPQMPRSLLVQNFNDSENILDPFMGSGTTVIEARNLGLNSCGVELNPFAYELARAKIDFEELKKLPNLSIGKNSPSYKHPHEEYLLKWFNHEQYTDLLRCLDFIRKLDNKTQRVLRIILSDQLRNNSLQDARDLRIRRLKNAPNTSNLLTDFVKRYEHIQVMHKKWVCSQRIFKNRPKIFNASSERLGKIIKEPVDGTISSPPYFSALPYVDTYRLSMVALRLISPEKITMAEKELIGARDISKLEAERAMHMITLLPLSIQALTKKIINNLEQDQSAGFRKRAVPFNLVRYSSSMQAVMKSLYSIERRGARNLWVVGTNKTEIGGESLLIDTPQIIAELAQSAGFKKVELEPVDAYSRYDIHSKNSIRREFIVKFNK